VLLCLVLVPQLRAQTPQLPLILPSAIVFDPQGNMYIADAGAHVVREVSLAGVVSVVAGTGVQGSEGDGGPATAAQLDSPMGLAIDASGNLYISDTHNHKVRRVAATSRVLTTIAGTGSAGFAGDGGQAKAALLDRPTALAVDSAGNLYIADSGNHRIRRLAATTGIVSTVAGNGIEGFSGDGGAAMAASLDSPLGIAVDAGGNLYIADTHNNRIRRVAASSGAITTVAGKGTLGFGGDAGTATAAAVALPRGVTVDANGNFYIADTANHRIRRISSTGTITTVAGDAVQGFTGDGIAAAGASLNSPASVALATNGAVTLADTENRRVRQIDPATGDIQTLPRLGSGAAPALSLSGPATLIYGTGSYTAKLTGLSATGGTVTIQDMATGTAISLGSAVLDATGSTTWNAESLPAGGHLLVATYSGISSPVLTVAVQPAPVTATAAPVSILYGQTVPTLSGSLNGVLPQDASKVSDIWATTAGASSSPGTYPISATLTGSAAANYSLSSVTGTVAITKAPTTTSLAVSGSSILSGSPLILAPQTASTTTGLPTGTILLNDGTSVLANLPVGNAFTAANLASGAHSLVASYSGDTNFLPSSSAVVVVTVGAPAADFTLASAGSATQTVAAGTAATFTFNVTTQGATLTSPILLAVKGIPVGATASINPASLPPGASTGSFTLTVQTPQARLAVPEGQCRAFWALLLIPAGMWRFRSVRRIRLAILSGSCILLALLPTGCGDRVNIPSGQSHTSTYTMTVTGTATGPSGSALQHSADVTLEVY
jgi:sugar lactone lactonase YvrE